MPETSTSAAKCRLILAIFLLASLGFDLWYLHHCPIDLGGDEAQYWDWSRNLDWSYYSKGPLVAYIIRGSCAVFGETMPAVRYPALVLSALTSIVTYLLTRKLFNSEKLALGATLLFYVVPIFVAGRIFMTIDAPMYLCWALATYFAAVAIFDDRRWMWMLVGIAIGMGFLAKYSAFLWLVGASAFLLFHRRDYKSILIAIVSAIPFTLPVVIWNSNHGWVSLRHVATQTGGTSSEVSLGNTLEFLAGQIGAVGPTLAIIMIGAIVYAISRRYNRYDANREKLLLLVWIGLPFFVLNFLTSLRTKVQMNWPLPAYFTLVILMAYFIATRMRDISSWKRWRGLFWVSVVFGVGVMLIARDTSIVFWIHPKIAENDPLARVRGWEELGRFVQQQRDTLRPGAFVLCDDYQQTAEMAFYVPDQPRTYCAGSYFGKRLSQYDMWPDRRLDPTSPLVGRDAVYVGKGGALPGLVLRAFQDVEKLPELPIMVRGTTVRTFKVWRCRGFLGIQPAAEDVKY